MSIWADKALSATRVGMSLYLKRLGKVKFIWPSSGSGEALQIIARTSSAIFAKALTGATRAGPIRSRLPSARINRGI